MHKQGETDAVLPIRVVRRTPDSAQMPGFRQFVLNRLSSLPGPVRMIEAS